ncbi:NTP transferase domain-containing protein [Campylobacter geochelonis]|uniref:Putative molybdopterin-guanine dinucleotide biosynthesis protein n=1 Tax=Campylobacter geochelonis TaxID=1780362 RepID=A0A128EMD9_9BACT|nr:NTP transferase domain-containing protein [Campylobacter geochelonis]QKF72110.1 molybdenum cofactor guanylyltransferase protein A [Campylobacter geochelonis]CZE45917.1 putative molybdopterin-guanine dinucleotide biosynthesis protein [Campylobacter geochelonis]CZE46714.1 putative molybdopterin-guanine dinucleotide biosynthesis protein [Campylobacter geochelonis]CZE49804.1 putative molybdopterin-guanine dinucleotide biosynthesis protein [Campylobacter geochelonis]
MEICVILGGGKSSRMGRDKTLLPFGGFATLTHYQFDKFSQIFKSVYVSAKGQKFNPNLPILKDRFDDFSPMGALFSILSNFKNQKVFIIPADMPFIEFDTVKKLYEISKDYEICVAKDEFFTHSLCGFFDSKVANLASEFYQKNEHKIGLLFKNTSFKSVEFKDSGQFFNINYLQDYEKVNI